MNVLSPIVVAGSIAIDRIMSFDGTYADHIRPGHLDSLSISVFLNNLTDAPGGVGANIAYSLAMLGDEPVLLGSAGKDAVAYLERLAHAGVNITHVHESELPTAAFNVITDRKQNQVGGFYPGAMADSAGLTLSPWREADPIVVVAPHDPAAMRRQVAECAEWGLRMVYDVGQQVSNLNAADLRAGMEACEILITNEYELAALAHKTGRSVDSITRTVPVVVTTLGSDGSVVRGARVPDEVRVGVVKPQAEADPTGAGDAYRAGFLYGLRRGWGWAQCMQLGATTAAYALEEAGTQNHSFTLANVMARYEEAFGERILDKR